MLDPDWQTGGAAKPKRPLFFSFKASLFLPINLGGGPRQYACHMYRTLGDKANFGELIGGAKRVVAAKEATLCWQSQAERGRWLPQSARYRVVHQGSRQVALPQRQLSRAVRMDRYRQRRRDTASRAATPTPSLLSDGERSAPALERVRNARLLPVLSGTGHLAMHGDVSEVRRSIGVRLRGPSGGIEAILGHTAAA